MLRTLLLSSAIAVALSACGDRPAAESAMPADTAIQDHNPLYVASALPFQAPPFDRIKDSDYLPAFNEGMKQHLAEVRKIADSAEPATFDNTIEALERSGETLK